MVGRFIEHEQRRFFKQQLRQHHPPQWTPLEVEDALYRHPAVVSAAVVAQPDPKWGETPCAFVELRPGATATEPEIIAHCQQLLARFKVPKKVIFCELPKTSTGKIQKFLLRERAKSTAAIE